MESPAPDIRPIAAWQAKLALAQNKLDEALNWVSNRAADTEGELNYLQEFEHLTLSRILITQGQNECSQKPLEKSKSSPPF